MVDLSALFAPFPRDSISWRAQNVTKEGDKAMALAYIDARDVMRRLDDVCGVAGWQCEYPHVGAKTICSIGILIEDKWIWKADGAGDTDIEAEKGAISDAFKRSAVKWGIGRYLYDMPAPWVPCKSYQGKDGKKKFSEFTADPWKFVKAVPKPTDPTSGAKPQDTMVMAAFPNEKARKIFHSNALTMIDSCLTLDELQGVREGNAKKFAEMRIGNDADKNAISDIELAYRAKSAALKKAKPTVDSIKEILDGDEIPFEDDGR